MSKLLSPKQVELLLPALQHVAELVQQRGTLSVEDLKSLSLGIGLSQKWAVQELQIWAKILANVRGAKDAGKRDIAVRALELRGIPEASARLAVEIVAPELPPSASAPIQVGQEVIAFGELVPGQEAHATLTVSGGPGRVRVGSDLLLVEPTAFGPAETTLKVTVRGGREGQILWDTIILESERERIEVEVSARWSTPPVAEKAEPSVSERPQGEPLLLRLRGTPKLSSLVILLVILVLALLFVTKEKEPEPTPELTIVWKVGSGRGVETAVRSVSFSPDGRLLASGGGGLVRVWEVESGREVRRLEHGVEVESVSFSPDGRLLASGGRDMVVRVWEVESGREVRRMVHRVWVESVSFSPDGRLLASGGVDGVVRVWDAESGRGVRGMEHGAWVWSVSFSPDGRFLASGGADGVVRVWEVESGREVRRLEHGAWVASVSFSPDGRLLASGGESGIWIWRVKK